MAEAYTLFFWLPALVSGTSLWIAWSNGIVIRPLLLLAWFAAALFLQLGVTRYTPGWAAGLTLQTALAVYLRIRMAMDL